MRRHFKKQRGKKNEASITDKLKSDVGNQKIENCKEDFCSCFNCHKCSKYRNTCMHGKCTSCTSCFCYSFPPCQANPLSEAGANGQTVQLSPTLNTGPTVITGPNKQISPSLDTGGK